jgi:hypothetical protein
MAKKKGRVKEHRPKKELSSSAGTKSSSRSLSEAFGTGEVGVVAVEATGTLRLLLLLLTGVGVLGFVGCGC